MRSAGARSIGTTPERGMRQRRRVGATLALVGGLTLAGLAGCAATGPSGGGPPAGASDDDLLVPPGHGTLRQEEITMSFRVERLQLKVTPLAEWVLRLTAPDTYDRLSGLAARHRPVVAGRAGVDDPTLFLVSFFSDHPDVTYEPEDIRVVNRGRRYRPLHIRPVTSGWGTQRLAARETQMAVYGFDAAVDLDMGLVVEYGDVRNSQWDGILPLLESELARVRARAAPYPSSSRPKRLILR